MSGAFIAVDWGTTNRRALRIEGTNVTARIIDAAGVASVQDFAGEAERLRVRLGDLPMLFSGMAGSSIGWREAPYVAVPAGIEQLAASLLEIDGRTRIVPGLSWRDGDVGDVMRGEEVQVLGAVRGGLIAPTATVVQPGTHSKWVMVEAGQITRFATAMTGELFALLRSSLIGPLLKGLVEPNEAFRAGIEQGARCDLAHDLFRIRAVSLLQLRPDRDAAAVCSGMLIGAECAARLAESDADVDVLADAPLGPLYLAAIEQLKRRGRLVDAEAAFVAGMTAIWECE